MQILVYDKNDAIIDSHTFPMLLHKGIFDEDVPAQECPINSERKKYRELRKLKDYYGTKYRFEKNGVESLILEMQEYRQYLGEENTLELKLIIEKISNGAVDHITVVSD